MSKRSSISGYFLASRNMHWVPVGASLFASNIGSEHFIGLAGSGAASGVAIATYEMNAIFILMILGWFFVPVYLSSGIYTMPEYLRLRFGGQRIRVFLSVLALLLYIFTKISADLLSGALYIKLALGLKGESGLYLSILVLLIIAAIFTIGGGLSAVIWTDFVQTILMVIGAFILMVFAMVEVGGYDGLVEKYSKAEADPAFTAMKLENGKNVSCMAIQENFMHMLRPADAPGDDLPWTGLFTGMLIGSIWYWCADQVIVQRTLASRNVSHAKGGVLLAGTLKFLPLFLLVLPGMAARVLYRNEVGCSDPVQCEAICQSPSGCTNIAFILLVLDLMPTGLRGLMLAVMMAALMSSLTSVFNSASTIFTIDIWTRFRSKASDSELLIVGRMFVVVLLVVSIAWIPIINSYKESQLFHYIQAVSNFLCPPITAVFLIALFWPRMNEPGAFWALMVGFAVGLIRFGLQFGYSSPPCGSGLEDTRPDFVKSAVDKFHYLHFGAFSFLLSSCVGVLVSLLTPAIAEDKLYRLTFWTRFSTEVRAKMEDEVDEEEDETQDKIAGTLEEMSSGRKCINLICGIENQADMEDENIKSAQDLAIEAAEFLKEDPKYKRLSNIVAVLVMSMAAFIYGFFA
eukprot:GFUD01006710.1.p1 GENE.GFUD01006710.1~~GFUD01006710.1.p1  ORF type:complete len:708 (+),score=187.08 GFUD01006710.1:236-2125(+)